MKERRLLLKWILLGLLAWPAAEFTAFALVALAIGILPAFALMILTSVAGAALLNSAGRARVAAFRNSMQQGRISVFEIGSQSLSTVIAGLLLLIPGFVTDAIGVVLLIGPLRRWLAAAFGRAIGGSGKKAPDGVIDLDPGEWRQVSQKKPRIPRKRPDPPPAGPSAV